MQRRRDSSETNLAEVEARAPVLDRNGPEATFCRGGAFVKSGPLERKPTRDSHMQGMPESPSIPRSYINACSAERIRLA
jgi:hypothetical protein